jgi:hypothetical protein
MTDEKAQHKEVFAIVGELVLVATALDTLTCSRKVGPLIAGKF